MCRFIDAEKATETNPGGYSVALLCRTLGVPRSAYYGRVASRPARLARRRSEELLVNETRVLHAGSHGAYGVPRVHAALVRAGREAAGLRVRGVADFGQGAARDHGCGQALRVCRALPVILTQMALAWEAAGRVVLDHP
ncbi:hypothetical protein NGB36_32800 [Streptomyces sp. RB6PN25]|uniref:HTH-like domain-containing protein n=1 Tax=Streptomyces humicola TaxID=2953240 RepID=A0ABT1Q5L2_9ACTN|nr:hypothetical protein [Streptomyces humicola]MCQ4085211.1 hypothetical protein [Streptomyces humicola]